LQANWSLLCRAHFRFHQQELELSLYFLLYFPVYELCGLKHTHLFLQTGGFISFPVWFGAALVAAYFWGIQSLVYLICHIAFHLLKKQQ
jgi:hypothetical protein